MKKRWQWGDREQVAFDTLKRQLTEAPVLAHPDPLKQWSVQTDASGFAIGAVLSQQQEDGSDEASGVLEHEAQAGRDAL